MSSATATIVGPGGDYQPDREVSDEDDAVGGGDGAGASEDVGGIETWPDDDEDEDEPRHA